jgi:hypothetical protein
MDRLIILAANALAGFLDFCVGACVAVCILKYFGAPTPLWVLPIGSLFALLPDFDIVYPILVGLDFKWNHHTTLMHRPIFLLPVAAIVAYGIAGPVWTLIAFVCVSWHYVHDSRLLGGDHIDWLWPLRESPHLPGDPPRWLRLYWLRPSKKSVAEVCIGLLLLILALKLAHFYIVAVIGIPLITFGVIAVWIVARLRRLVGVVG